MIKILVFTLVFVNTLLSKDLDRFYINNFKSDKNSKEIAKKIQNLITTELTSNGKEKFLFLDDGTVVDLLNQETRRLLLGAETKNNISKIGRATKSQQMILATIKKINMKRYEISLRHVSTEPYSILSNINLPFYTYQLKYYSSEIAKKILNPSYKINQKKAPSLSDTNVQINDLSLSNINLQTIKLDSNKYRNDLNLSGIKLDKFSLKNIDRKEVILDKRQYKDDGSLSAFIDSMQYYIEDADKAYESKEYLDAIYNYKAILLGIETFDNDEDTKKKLEKDRQEVEKRITISYVQFYQFNIQKIDDDFYKEKKYLEAKNEYKKLYEVIELDENKDDKNKEKFLRILKKREKVATKEFINTDFLEKIKQVDQEFEEKENFSLPKLQDFHQRYNNILQEYQNEEPYIQIYNISKGLKARIEKVYEKEIIEIDTLYREKKYEQAWLNYKSIYAQIKDDFNQSQKRDEILKIIAKREKIAKKEFINTNFLEKIKQVDQNLKNENEISLFNLENFHKQYKEILEAYQNREQYIQVSNISQGLKTRLDSILDQIVTKNEQIGDDYLAKYDFKKSEEQYQSTIKSIEDFQFSSKLKQRKYIYNIEKKIRKIRILGKDYYRNKIIAFSYFADVQKGIYVIEKSIYLREEKRREREEKRREEKRREEKRRAKEKAKEKAKFTTKIQFNL